MSIYAKLTRDHISPDCILGTIVANGQVFYSLERPWMDNTPNISCIPAGFYHCEYKAKSNNGKLSDVYEIQNVPDRAGVLIHAGNVVTDSHGCILLGLGREIEEKKIVSSKLGMTQFIGLMGKTFDLMIEERV